MESKLEDFRKNRDDYQPSLTPGTDTTSEKPEEQKQKPAGPPTSEQQAPKGFETKPRLVPVSFDSGAAKNGNTSGNSGNSTGEPASTPTAKTEYSAGRSRTMSDETVGTTDERAGFCQNCGKPLTKDTIRVVGTAVYCEPCLAAKISGVPPVAGAGTPGSADTVWQWGAGMPPGWTPPTGPNPSLAALLGLIPGVGAMYNEQYAKGVVHLVIFAVLVQSVACVGHLRAVCGRLGLLYGDRGAPYGQGAPRRDAAAESLWIQRHWRAYGLWPQLAERRGASASAAVGRG